MVRQQSCSCAVLCALLAAAAASASAINDPAGFRKTVSFIVSEGEKLTDTFPPLSKEAVGSTSVYSTELKEGGRKIGSAVWTGTYIDARVSATENVTRVHYMVQCDFTEGSYKGSLVASGIWRRGRDAESPMIVLGGSGDFEGATGSFTWGVPAGVSSEGGPFYTFKLNLAPKRSQPSLSEAGSLPTPSVVPSQPEAGVSGRRKP